MWRRFLIILLIVAGCDELFSSCSPPPQRTAPPTSVAIQPPAATQAPSATRSPAATATPSPTTAAATATARPSPTAAPPTPLPLQSVIFDHLVAAGVLEESNARDYLGSYATDPSGDHEHASGELPGSRENYTDIRFYGGFIADFDDDQSALLDDAVACDGDFPDDIHAYCNLRQPFTAGRYGVLLGVLDGLVPAGGSPPPLVIDALVFDIDGEASNNWSAMPDFPGDSYQGTDLWLELYRRGSMAQLIATNEGDDGQFGRNNTNTTGRVLVADNMTTMQREVAWFVPLDRLLGADQMTVGYRVVSIGSSTGDFEPENSGHDYTLTLAELADLAPCGGTCANLGR